MLNTPFLQSRLGTIGSKSLLKSPKFSFNGIITNLEKTVSTINQVIPLYNQVQPLISNSKTLINAFKNTKKENKKAQRKSTFNPNIINVDPVQTTNTSTTSEKKEFTSEFFTNVNSPNKPFFI